MESMYRGAHNDTWEFSDNQGLMSTSYSTTSVESPSIYSVQNSYNHVWFRDSWTFSYHYYGFTYTFPNLGVGTYELQALAGGSSEGVGYAINYVS